MTDASETTVLLRANNKHPYCCIPLAYCYTSSLPFLAGLYEEQLGFAVKRLAASELLRYASDADWFAINPVNVPQPSVAHYNEHERLVCRLVPTGIVCD